MVVVVVNAVKKEVVAVYGRVVQGFFHFHRYSSSSIVVLLFHFCSVFSKMSL